MNFQGICSEYAAKVANMVNRLNILNMLKKVLRGLPADDNEETGCSKVLDIGVYVTREGFSPLRAESTGMSLKD